jgi:hypothetical protein
VHIPKRSLIGCSLWAAPSVRRDVPRRVAGARRLR